eukprot:Tbor_TRINITY_DN5827_c3_g1::TRINITY_DN5827_c3_g1_i1::g.6451::m.6451
MSLSAIAALRNQTLKAAKQFKDYNYRVYFVNKTKNVFRDVESMPPDEIKSFINGEGKKNLNQMRRMSFVNMMYASVPVLADNHKTKYNQRYRSKRVSSSTKE